MESSEKTAFITGGSSGIGFEIAKELLKKDYNIVLFARNREKLLLSADNLKEFSKPENFIEIVSMDVSDNNDVKEKISGAVNRFGTPYYLINSAGIAIADYFENIAYEEFDSLIKINLYGVRNTIKAILPHMKENKKGHIVNLSSVAGIIGMFGYTLYSSSKFALVGLTESLRGELKPYNIDVSIVCPPEVKTPLIEGEAKRLPKESRKVKNLAGLLTPEFTAKYIVKKIEKKKFLIIPGFIAKFLYLNHRISNGFLTRIVTDVITRSP